MGNLTAVFERAFSANRVLVTGHTGFKGAWLTQWLLKLGAEVMGFSLEEPPTQPCLFEQLNLKSRVDHRVGDICDASQITQAVAAANPDFVFHLAAQPLVRVAFEKPLETFATNVMGTANLLESIRKLKRNCVVIVVTTDKCYENREWLHSYREEDPMGGHDPYSASKGCVELVASAYRRSFFAPHSGVQLATARAGNVIGGGDWAQDRIVPDCMRAIQNAEPVAVRNKAATRPWQHVLEPLSGYLLLAASLAKAEDRGQEDRSRQLGGPFNFGPGLQGNRSVGDLVAEINKHWLAAWRDDSDPAAPHEASKLNLAIDKAWHLLGWKPIWGFERTVQHTVDWYRNVQHGESPQDVTSSQISLYESESQAALPRADSTDLALRNKR